MMSFLDLLPSSERAKIRARLRSPEAYERLREKVKGPKQLADELNKSEKIAELNFTLETEPEQKEVLKNKLAEDIKEQGAENILENAEDLPEAVKNALKQGKFEVAIDVHPDTQADQLTVYLEGKIAEKIPVKKSLSDRYAASLSGGGREKQQTTIQVQVNGLNCAILETPPGWTEEDIMAFVLSNNTVIKCLANRNVVRHEYQQSGFLNLITMV